MPFVKGQKKSGGRKKGTPNKFNSNLAGMCERLKINPFEALLVMAQDVDVDASLRFRALKEVSEYLYPKRHRMEFDGSIYAHVVREVEELSKLPTAELKKLAEEEIKKADNGS